MEKRGSVLVPFKSQLNPIVSKTDQQKIKDSLWAMQDANSRSKTQLMDVSKNDSELSQDMIHESFELDESYIR